jgi:hypothetical protein
MSKKFNPRIGYHNIHYGGDNEKKFFCINDDNSFIAEELSNFKFESIKNFLTENKLSYEIGSLNELEKCSYDIIHKLYVLEQNSIPRVLIERNFNSKI